MSRFTSRAGSALIWALAVALILSIVLIAGFSMVQRQQNANVQQHIENQAYYTAMSINRAILNWLDGASNDFIVLTDDSGNILDQQLQNSDDRNVFIDWILAQEPNEDDPGGFFPLTIGGIDYPDTLGEISLFATHDGGSQISIKTTATYNGETGSVIGKLTSDSTMQVDPGKPGVAKIEVPPPPAYPKDTADLTLLTGNQSVSGTTGKYYTTDRTNNLSGTMNTLVVQGTSKFNFTGSADIVVVKANATLEIGNGAYIGTLIIEDGGQTSFVSNSKLFVKTPKTVCDVFVMPGGKFINTAQGFNQANIMIYGMASNDSKKIAQIQLGKMQVAGMVIQPVGDYGGYTADVGNPATIDFGTTGVIHLPLGYTYNSVSFNLSNFKNIPSWADISDRVCNRLVTGPRPDEAPFCPHFLPLNDPSKTTTTERWSFAGFEEG